jgi:hypothetical protein
MVTTGNSPLPGKSDVPYSASLMGPLLPVFTLLGNTAFVKRMRSQPRGYSLDLGRCPNKQKQIFGNHAESLF